MWWSKLTGRRVLLGNPRTTLALSAIFGMAVPAAAPVPRAAFPAEDPPPSGNPPQYDNAAHYGNTDTAAIILTPTCSRPQTPTDLTAYVNAGGTKSDVVKTMSDDELSRIAERVVEMTP